MTSLSVSDSSREWKAERMLLSYLLHLSLYFSLPILLKEREWVLIEGEDRVEFDCCCC